jgi:hypothetical protein
LRPGNAAGKGAVDEFRANRAPEGASKMLSTAREKFRFEWMRLLWKPELAGKEKIE